VVLVGDRKRSLKSSNSLARIKPELQNNRRVYEFNLERRNTNMTAAAGELLTQAASRSNFDGETSPSYDDLLAFVRVRPRLFAIAYRMLGNAAEAEDIVQDVWLRWQTANRSVVLDAPAFLATTTTRLCISRAQSARSRRETYIGPGLPEPVDTGADPFLSAERSEALKLAVVVLLKKLSPTERAAYVLREAFHYSYREIADSGKRVLVKR
jgi:DNA-directed RNA polymerase specialized sigma24 family protein